MATKCLAVDPKTDGTLFISLNPGWTRTDMGGPTAALSTEESVSDMIKSLGKFSDKDNGGFFQRDGTPLPF